MSLEQKLFEKIHSKILDEGDSVKLSLFKLVWSNKQLKEKFLEGIEFEIAEISVKEETRGRRTKKVPVNEESPSEEPVLKPKERSVQKPKKKRSSEPELSDSEIAKRIAEALGEDNSADEDTIIPEVIDDGEENEDEEEPKTKTQVDLEREILFG